MTMKNKRSSTWLKRHGKLQRQESKVKVELEQASTNLESQVKKIAMISLVSGVALVAGYGLYKAFSHSKKPEIKPQQKAPATPLKSKPKFGFGLKSLLFERLAMIGINFIGAQLAILLSNKFGLVDGDDEDERD